MRCNTDTTKTFGRGSQELLSEPSNREELCNSSNNSTAVIIQLMMMQLDWFLQASTVTNKLCR